MSVLSVRSMGDIRALDNMLHELTGGLSYPMGSLLKISSHYLPNFGIELTDENRPEIERESLGNYFSCWGRAAKVTLEAIKKATRDAGFPVDNSDLNNHVGEMTVEILLSMADRDTARQFTLLDIGAGDGETTAAVLDAMCNQNAYQLAERCQFVLIEPSEENVWNAVRNLKDHRIKQKVRAPRITTIGGTDHDFIGRMRPGEFDLVYSSAVFHHMIFPTYLDTVRQGMREDGVLVVGDWYTTIFKHPAFIAEILLHLNIDKTSYIQFQSLFNCSDGDEKKLCEGMDRNDIITNYRMLRYIVQIGREFLQIPPENRDEFLEGHCSFGERKADLESRGFIPDMKALKESGHPGFATLETNIKNVDPYGAAKVAAFGRIPEKALARQAPERPKQAATA